MVFLVEDRPGRHIRVIDGANSCQICILEVDYSGRVVFIQLPQNLQVFRISVVVQPTTSPLLFCRRRANKRSVVWSDLENLAGNVTQRCYDWMFFPTLNGVSSDESRP